MNTNLNLTDKQLEFAQWLAQQSQSGNLPDTFTVRWKHKGYVPETGIITELSGKHPEISFATFVALENAGLILAADKQVEPARKGGVKKVRGVETFQFGNPRYETSRTFVLLGNIFNVSNTSSSASSIEPKSQTGHLEGDRLGSNFIDLRLIDGLRSTINKDFDLSRLVRYCEEINDNFRSGNYSSVIFLARAILDHCPPIFEQKDFDNVAAQHGGISFKSIATRLNTSLKKIADHHIHKQVGKREVLPVQEEINFSNDLNFLLARVIEKLEG